jgi:uncharacterized protein (TIRG00374 family)
MSVLPQRDLQPVPAGMTPKQGSSPASRRALSRMRVVLQPDRQAVAPLTQITAQPPIDIRTTREVPQEEQRSTVSNTPPPIDIITDRMQRITSIYDLPTEKLPSVSKHYDEVKEEPKKKKSKLQLIVRIAISAVLFSFILKSVNWSILITALTHVDYTYLLVGLSAGLLCVVFSAYGWRSVTFAENIYADLAWLIDLYFVGIGFSHFLPTSMGGDAVKAFYVGKSSGNIAGAASAVLMSRITSFLGMLLIALPGLFIFRAQFTHQVIVWFLLLSLLLVSAIVGSIFIAALLPKVSSKFLRGKWTKNRLFAMVIEVGTALSDAVKRPGPVIIAILYGMLFWGASFLNYYGYGVSLGLHIPLSFYVVAIPFVSIIAALPISINGFGVRESAFVYLFSTIHVPSSESLLLALLMDTQVLLFGLIGGYLYLAMSNKKQHWNGAPLEQAGRTVR